MSVIHFHYATTEATRAARADMLARRAVTRRNRRQFLAVAFLCVFAGLLFSCKVMANREQHRRDVWRRACSHFVSGRPASCTLASGYQVIVGVAV